MVCTSKDFKYHVKLNGILSCIINYMPLFFDCQHSDFCKKKYFLFHDLFNRGCLFLFYFFLPLKIDIAKMLLSIVLCLIVTSCLETRSTFIRQVLSVKSYIVLIRNYFVAVHEQRNCLNQCNKFLPKRYLLCVLTSFQQMQVQKQARIT